VRDCDRATAYIDVVTIAKGTFDVRGAVAATGIGAGVSVRVGYSHVSIQAFDGCSFRCVGTFGAGIARGTPWRTCGFSEVLVVTIAADVAHGGIRRSRA
jgi:hypothetical protein